MNKKIAIIVLILMGCGWFFRKFLGGHLFSTVVAVACGGEQSRDVETMDPRLRKKIVPIMTSLRDAGFEFQISSVYRSPKRQQCLYDISDQIRKVTGCCGPPLALSDCLASGIAKRDCVVLSEGSCHQRAKVQKKIEGASFSTGRLGGLIPCLGGVTNTTKSCHNNVRKGKPASLAIDLHIYGVSEKKTVDFYKQLRQKANKAGLRSGGDFKQTNPHWKKHGLGWDPGHVQVMNCKSKLRLK